MNTPTNQDELSNFMKSLADAERLKIAGLLGVEALTADEAAQRLGMEPAQVAHNLEVLVDSGLAHQEGSSYRLDSQALEKLTAGCWPNLIRLRPNMRATNSKLKRYVHIYRPMAA